MPIAPGSEPAKFDDFDFGVPFNDFSVFMTMNLEQLQQVNFAVLGAEVRAELIRPINAQISIAQEMLALNLDDNEDKLTGLQKLKTQVEDFGAGEQ